MLLFSEEIYKKIVDQFILKLLIGKKYLIHGTFASKKSKFMTDVDVTNYYRFSDTPPCDSCKEDALTKINTLLKKLSPNTIFQQLLAGFDKRFLLGGRLNDKGEITGFNPASLKTKMNKLLKEKVITVDEHFAINTLIKSKMTTSEYYLLSEKLLSFAQLIWTAEEIKKGVKEHRGEKFRLIDMMTAKFGTIEQNNPFVFNYIIRYDDLSYVQLDVALIFYSSPPGVYDSNKVETVRDDQFKKEVKLINFIFGTTNEWIYIGIYKNLAQEKYLKAFKRLRTLLTSIMFNPNTGKANKNELYLIRKEMLDELNHSDYNKYNQIKAQIEIILYLMKHSLVGGLEINGMILQIIEDLWSYTDYNSDKKKLKKLFDEVRKMPNKKNKNKQGNKHKTKKEEMLEQLSDQIKERINKGAKKLFEEYYKKTQKFVEL